MISPRTRAALIRLVARESHAEISTLAVEVGLDQAAGYTRHDRAAALVTTLFNQMTPEEASHRALDVIRRILSTSNPHGIEHKDMLDALALDGLAFDNGKILPATPEPAALQKELSLLEIQLQAGGFGVALAHYQQAADNLAAGNHEAANGQTRSFIESLFIALCSKKTGTAMNEASAALQHLRNNNWLDNGEWNHLRYFWADIQDNGPHHGLTTAEEALFRFHYATAVARYLLSKQ
jgi:hypothetical protein